MTSVSRPRWRCATTPWLLALALLSSCRLEGTYGRSPYVHNLTRQPLTVQVRLLEGIPTCSLLDDHVGFFEDRDFEPAVRYELAPGEILPILSFGIVELDDDGRDCGAAIVRVGDDFNRVISWHEGDLRSVPEFPRRDGETVEQGLLVGGGGERFFVEAGELLRVSALRRQQAPAACDVPAGEPIAWSGVVDGVLQGLRAGVDGCMVLQYAGGGTGFVCVPQDLFPFGAGDALEVSPTAVGAGIVIRAADHELELRRDMGIAPPLGDVAPIEASRCAPQRDACGSLIVPGRVAIDGRGRSAGEMLTTRGDDGRELRVYLGRVQRVPLVGPGCTAVGLEGERLDVALLGAPRVPTSPPSAPIGDDAGVEDDGGVEWMEVMP